MSSTKYTYSKIVSADTLEYQIRTSQITVALDSIVAGPASVDIWFKATLSSNDESILTAIINTHTPIPLLYQGAPKDPDNAPAVRLKAAKAGWSYQLHSLNFYTAKYGSLTNQKLNPVTRLIEPLGFATAKFYDENNTELTEPDPVKDHAVWTVIDWAPNHEMEVIGGSLYQKEAPAEHVFAWVHLAPGIVNYPFLQGGLNLEMIGRGNNLRVDGRVAKYLHPSLPVPGINKFRLTFHHPAGLQHEVQFVFEFFKPTA